MRGTAAAGSRRTQLPSTGWLGSAWNATAVSAGHPDRLGAGGDLLWHRAHMLDPSAIGIFPMLTRVVPSGRDGPPKAAPGSSHTSSDDRRAQRSRSEVQAAHLRPSRRHTGVIHPPWAAHVVLAAQAGQIVSQWAPRARRALVPQGLSLCPRRLIWLSGGWLGNASGTLAGTVPGTEESVESHPRNRRRDAPSRVRRRRSRLQARSSVGILQP